VCIYDGFVTRSINHTLHECIRNHYCIIIHHTVYCIIDVYIIMHQWFIIHFILYQWYIKHNNTACLSMSVTHCYKLLGSSGIYLPTGGQTITILMFSTSTYHRLIGNHHAVHGSFRLFAQYRLIICTIAGPWFIGLYMYERWSLSFLVFELYLIRGATRSMWLGRQRMQEYSLLSEYSKCLSE